MFEQDFLQLLTEYPSAIHERKRFVGLLKDYFPEEQMKVNLMKTLYEMSIAEEIEKVGAVTNAFAYRFVKKMIDEYGTTRRNADWAVSVWCVCYGGQYLHKQCDISLQQNAGKGPAIETDNRDASKKYRDLFQYTKVQDGYAVCGYTGTYTQTIVFQNRFNNQPVVEVYPSSFQESNAVELIMTEGYKTIGSRAFSGCTSLRQIVMSPTLVEIGAYAFQGDGSLGIINLPHGIERIDKYAFASTGIRTIELPSTLYWTGSGVLSNCKKLHNIKIPKNITELSDRMFMGCEKLFKVELPETLQRIGDEAFKDCTDLDFLAIPDSVTMIGDNAFAGCHKKIIVQCSMGSYAEEYCRSHQIKYQLL